MSKWIFVDVEATGRSPITGAMTEFGAVDYKTRQTFHGVIWESRPAEDNPAVSIITGKLLNPLPDVMSDFARWLYQSRSCYWRIVSGPPVIVGRGLDGRH